MPLRLRTRSRCSWAASGEGKRRWRANSQGVGLFVYSNKTTPAFLRWTPCAVPTSTHREYATWTLVAMMGSWAPSPQLSGGVGGVGVAFVTKGGLGGGQSCLRGGGPHPMSRPTQNALCRFSCHQL